MNRLTLTELAANPDLISGIYNYCDRWCEKCEKRLYPDRGQARFFREQGG